MIDLHCHILPGMDDGPQTMEETLCLAEAMATAGIRSVVATPHTLNGFFINKTDEIIKQTARVQATLAEANISLDIYPGAEVHACPDILARLDNGDATTLNNNLKYLLLEFPVQSVPATFREDIFSLKLRGIIPIIAHPERNLEIMRHLEVVYELVEAGALCQLTAMSITGEFGPGVWKCANQLLRCRLAHVIASDGHSPGMRTPALLEAVEAAALVLDNYTEAEDMVTSTPAAIIAGRDLVVPEPQRQKKSWFFWKG